MGLFSSSSKTYVGTTTSRVIEDKKFISSIKSGTIKSIFAKSSATVDYIMEDLVNGIGFRAKPYYKYAKNHYPLGLPQATGVSEFGGGRIMQDYLETFTTTQEPVVLKNFIARYNYWHAALYWLDQTYDMNPKTAELRHLTNQQGGKKVYLTEMILIMNEATHAAIAPESLVNKSVLYQNTSFTISIEPIPNNDIKVYFSYIWDTGETVSTGGGEGGPLVTTPVYDGEIVLATVNIFNPDYNPEHQYFHTIYEEAPVNNFAWFTYRIGSGQNDALDNVFNPDFNATGSYFPWVYFRYNKVKGNEDLNDPVYKSAKKLLKKINMDYDDLCDKIHENPDIADVEQAMLMWSIEADSQNPLDIRYLFEYFDNTFIDSGGMIHSLNYEDFDDVDRLGEMIRYNALIVQDARFKLGISNMGMYKRTFAGSIGPVGTYTAGERDLSFKYQRTEETEGGSFTYDQFWPVPSHYYRKQVQPGWYEEIIVLGMGVQYHIYGEYQVIADGDTADERSDLLLIPLDLSITKEFSLMKREELYSRSLYLIFNSRVTVKVRWYQSSFFQFLMIVVAIAITLYTGMDAMTSFLAGTATMTATQILTAVLLTGLEYLVTAVAFKLFVKVVGVKVAFLVALIGMAYGYTAKFGDKLGAELSKNMPHAADLLKASTGLAKAVKSEYEGDMLGMKKEMDAMSTDLQALGVKMKSIEDEMSENSTYAAFISFGEQPEDYYNRTVHAGNIGMIGIDAVSNFVDRMLSLPQPSGELV